MRSITFLFGLLGTLFATGLPGSLTQASTMQQGILEFGDAIFFYDGSLYDSYPIHGQSGQTIAVELRSYDFDPFLAVVGPNGEWLAHNNDVNSDSKHAALSFTFPDEAIYYIFVNTYNVTGQGDYVLELSYLSGNAPHQTSSAILQSSDAPPMPTPVLIHPFEGSDLSEDGSGAGDRAHQNNGIGIVNTNITGVITAE